MSELHEAAAAGDSGALRLALDQEGCKVDAEDPACGNRTALHLAAGGGHTDCVRLLIRAGADVAKQSRGGWTAAHCAAETGRLLVLRLLTDSSTECLRPDDHGDRPSQVAQLYGFSDTCAFLTAKEQAEGGSPATDASAAT
eukprot:m.186887 g.186887  ORF g.186887 m.186887 type:complete len:141 (-) comp18147_c0_seq5:71-493(-)